MTQTEIEVLIGLVPIGFRRTGETSLTSLIETIKTLVSMARAKIDVAAIEPAEDIASILTRVPEPYRIGGADPVIALRNTVSNLVSMLNRLARPDNAELGEAAAHRDTMMKHIPEEYHVKATNDGEEDRWGTLSSTVAKLLLDVKAKRRQAETLAQLCQMTKATSLDQLKNIVAHLVNANETAEKEFKELYDAIPGKWRVTVNGEPALGVTINTLVSRLEATEASMAERVYDGKKHGPGTAAREEYELSAASKQNEIEHAIEEIQSHNPTDLIRRLPAEDPKIGEHLYAALMFWDRKAIELERDSGKMIAHARRDKVELVTRMAQAFATTLRHTI